MTINIPDEAFILAAGKGTRLRPYTDSHPKPMVEVWGKPIIDHAIDKLVHAGVKRVIVNLYHLGGVLRSHLETRRDIEIIFSEETELLDTGGGVKNALRMLSGAPFYLINGDAFWIEGPDKPAFERLAAHFDAEKMDMLLLMQRVEDMALTAGVGDYAMTPAGRAVRQKDKNGDLMFAGVRIVHPRVFENAKEGAFSFLELMDRSETGGRLYGLIHEGDWHHISTPEDLERVNKAKPG